MITQIVDQNHFRQRARDIRLRVPKLLSLWGLPSRFNRWRLTQDPRSGMVVLFAVLNTRYVATQTTRRSSDYFDPRLLHDLSNDLHLQVVPSDSDGLRYAFILDRGLIGMSPTHMELPFLEGDGLVLQLISGDQLGLRAAEPQIVPAPRVIAEFVDDHTLVNRGVGAFLKVFDDIQLRDEAAQQNFSQDPPEVVVVEVENIYERLKEERADMQRINHLELLFDESVEQL
jgi:hypothetical protein